jgi:hypothetical protein
MKILIALFITVFSINTFAKSIKCTTKMSKYKTNKYAKAKICGAVEVRASDNGVKYRRRPRFCKKFTVEFFSIKASDQRKFRSYCSTIFTKSCYLIRIKDSASRAGMNGLSSYIVFPSAKAIPTRFNLAASGIGHKRGIIPGAGTFVHINLSCLVR